MKATKEQIIAEANRRWDAELWPRHKSVIDHAIDIMCENWTPPEPVDPDVPAFRDWYAGYDSNLRPGILTGKWDNCAFAKAYLAGARMAREREQERAKVLVEYVKSRVLSSRAAEVAIAKYRGEA